MQLTHESKKVVRSNQFAESKFKIEASSKAFQILSSRLYADGIKAIIRELCTNASDAHAAAGIADSPIHVHCPSLFDGSFSVRDFGNGIDPEDFEKIFTTYFYSTKSDTNNQVGCFGLGSKSPFAYTQQFTVENHFSGKKYIYSCFINESGEPSVTLLSTVDTDETGVKISFPVKREDWYSFEVAAKKVLQWFDVTPKCNINIDNRSFKELNKTFTYGQCYDIVEYGIRMGQVVYPVNEDYFSDFLNKNTIINVNIGDVDITPSRESLEYSKHTCETLDKLKAIFAKEFNEKIESIMDSDKSEYGKFIDMWQYFESKGIKTKLRIDTIDANFPNRPQGSSLALAKVDGSLYDNKVMQITKSSWRDKLDREDQYMSINNKTILMVKDKSKDINQKISQLLKSKGDNNYSVILIPSDKKDLFVKNHNLKKEDLILASEYQLDSTSQSFYRTSTNCSEFYRDSYGCKKVGTKITKDDKVGFYIPETFATSIIGSWREKDFKAFHTEKGTPKLYIFTESQYKNLKISERNFTNFLDVLISELESKKAEIIDAIALDGVTGGVAHDRSMLIGEKTKTDNFFKKYYEFFANTNIAIDKAAYYDGLMGLIQHHKRELFSEVRDAVNAKTIEFTKDISEAKKKYPLAGILLDNPNFNDIIDSVVEYVDMMENKGE